MAFAPHEDFSRPRLWRYYQSTVFTSRAVSKHFFLLSLAKRRVVLYIVIISTRNLSEIDGVVFEKNRFINTIQNKHSYRKMFISRELRMDKRLRGFFFFLQNAVTKLFGQSSRRYIPLKTGDVMYGYCPFPDRLYRFNVTL